MAKTAAAPQVQEAPTRLVKMIGNVDGAELGIFGIQGEGGVIKGVVKKDHNGASITLARESRRKTYSYTYHSASGKAERDAEKFPGDWIGYIQASLTNFCRIRSMVVAFVCKPFNLPTTAADLQKFIESRPQEKNGWFTIGNGNKYLGGVYLPRLLAFFEGADESMSKPPDEAVISNVTVAPRHQKKGYGTLLHLCLAQFLRDEGYKTLTSDTVGMNTAGELAVWKRLKGKFPAITKQEPMSHICVPRLMQSIQVIDEEMYKTINEGGYSHFGGRVLTAGQLEKIDFPQYEWDLSKPILI